MKKPPTATITRLTPKGSTLAYADGKPIALGDKIEEGCSVILSTPDGSSGAVQMSARIAYTIASRQLVPAPRPLSVVDAFGPSTGGPMGIDVDV